MVPVTGRAQARPVLLVDLDGTLVDTFPDLWRSAVHVLRVQGLPVPVADDRLRSAVGQGAAGLLAAAGAPSPVPTDWVEALVADYAGHLTGASRPFAGTETWWAWPLAVVTNKPRRLAEPLLAQLYSGPVPLWTPDDVPRSKPAPDMLEAALQTLGRLAGEACMIGDDLRDLEAAEAAGVAFVAAGWGYGGDLAWARTRGVPVAEEPGQVPDLVAERLREGGRP